MEGKEAVGRAGGPVLIGWTEKLGQSEWPWPRPGGGLWQVRMPIAVADTAGGICQSMMPVDAPLPKLKMWVSRASTMGVSPPSLGSMP